MFQVNQKLVAKDNDARARVLCNDLLRYETDEIYLVATRVPIIKKSEFVVHETVDRLTEEEIRIYFRPVDEYPEPTLFNSSLNGKSITLRDNGTTTFEEVK